MVIIPAEKCSCHGCKKKHIGCHSSCDEYTEFRQRVDEKNEAERRGRMKLSDKKRFGYYSEAEKRAIRERGGFR